MAKKKKKKPLSEAEKIKRKHRNEIRETLKNIGFKYIPFVNKEFRYETRTSELDDIFYYKNIIILCEYTTGSQDTHHLLNKGYIYRLINEDTHKFFNFLISNQDFSSVKTVYDEVLSNDFTLNELQIVIVYCSLKSFDDSHKISVRDLAGKVIFFDYPIVQYFKDIAKVVKKSAIYEFLSFLQIPYQCYGENIHSSEEENDKTFTGYLIPEEKTSFDKGYKIVSYYIDACSLLQRAYVLRQNGWRDVLNIGLYQRMLIPSKIKKMRQYLNNQDRVFINNIITTVSKDAIELITNDGQDNEIKIDFDQNGDFIYPNKTKVLPVRIRIPNKTNIIGIIDGQHRTFAYHEGEDVYEKKISRLRIKQNLLVTSIIYPDSLGQLDRQRFEANLFLEINSNQTGAPPKLKQDIEMELKPLAPTSIAKRVLIELKKSGPLADQIEEYWFEKGKLKTASIVAYGLKPLLKIDPNSTDSIYSLLSDSQKEMLTGREINDAAFKEYVVFAVIVIKEILSAFRNSIGKAHWHIDRNDADAILTVTTVNGFLNTLRLLIENSKALGIKYYEQQLINVSDFNFKKYKSSQYRKMGRDLYETYFKFN